MQPQGRASNHFEGIEAMANNQYNYSEQDEQEYQIALAAENARIEQRMKSIQDKKDRIEKDKKISKMVGGVPDFFAGKKILLQSMEDIKDVPQLENNEMAIKVLFLICYAKKSGLTYREIVKKIGRDGDYIEVQSICSKLKNYGLVVFVRIKTRGRDRLAILSGRVFLAEPYPEKFWELL